MTTISVELPDELAEKLAPLQDRLPEIIELGLRQLDVEVNKNTELPSLELKQKVLDALQSSGIVTVPKTTAAMRSRPRYTPIKAGGPPASELIIKDRR